MSNQKVRVRFFEAGKWADKVWEPQFYVKANEEKEVSPELARIVVDAGRGVVVPNEAATETKAEKPEVPASGAPEKKSKKQLRREHKDATRAAEQAEHAAQGAESAAIEAEATAETMDDEANVQAVTTSRTAATEARAAASEAVAVATVTAQALGAA